MTTVTVSTGVPIQLGYQYDDYATEVVFPASIIEPFTTTYGSGGTFAIWYRRSGDATGYPIGNPLVVFNGTTVTWTVVETDVANPGQAQVQLRYIKDEHCVMSQMFTAIVEDSVDIGTEIPEPMEQWADAIIKAGSGGQPTAVTSSSAMTNHSAIYLYMGSEGGYQYGHIYYWDGTGWNDGGAYGGGSTGSGLTEDVKQALLACFENVAWKIPENPGDPTGEDLIDALESALYPPVNLQSISAVYTQSGTVYDTDDLDDLRDDLVVTANYDNSTSEVVTNYTLSGTLAGGTSTITVSYGGKTTTFNVTVTTVPYITNGLIAYWDGIDNTGNGHDSSATKWVDLINGYELNLRDSTYTTWNNDSVSMSGNVAQGFVSNGKLWDVPTNATIEFVIRPESNGTQVIGNFDTAMTGDSVSETVTARRFILYSDNTVGFVGASGYTYTNPKSSASEIRKMAATYTDFVVNKAYVDNTEVTLSNKTHSFTMTGTNEYRIGVERLSTNGYPYTGKIYAMRVYNRILTTEELTKNYNYDISRFNLGT